MFGEAPIRGTRSTAIGPGDHYVTRGKGLDPWSKVLESVKGVEGIEGIEPYNRRYTATEYDLVIPSSSFVYVGVMGFPSRRIIGEVYNGGVGTKKINEFVKSRVENKNTKQK